MFNYSFKILFKRLGLLLLIYQVFRIAFYYFNRPSFEAATTNQTLFAFLHGLRFDLSILTTINLPFIFLSVSPPEKYIQKKVYQRVLLWLYTVVNIPFFFLNLIDIEYFKFIGRRTTNEVFTITQDIIGQSGQLFLHYWWFSLLLMGLGFLLLKLYPAYKEQHFPVNNYFLIQKGLALGFLIIAAILVIRGGTQYKPLKINHAYILEPPTLGNVTLNSTFTFIRSLNNQILQRKNYFKSQEDIARHLHFNPYQYSITAGKPVRNNVVILIVESLSSEYTGIENKGRGFTPFFDSLATQGLFFTKNYANGTQSINALPSVLAGLPSLMNEPFIASNYELNQIYGLGDILKPYGYGTSFFHGGLNGTMSFNYFAKRVGIEQYYGLDEYPKEKQKQDFDGLWGIFDEPYLQYVASTLTEQKQPFAATIFTLSSHDPYTIPAKYEGKFPKGKIGILEAIAYADFSLKQFFRTASKQAWYPNTLFIITGDHTQLNFRKGFYNKLARHKVPLLFFHPGKKIPLANTNQITQHVDILPSIVDYLNIKTDKLLPFGRSVFDTTRSDKALFYIDNYYTLVKPDYLADLWADDETISLHYFKSHNYKPVRKSVPVKEKLYGQEIKAYLQYYRNGLIDNSLYYWLKEKK